MVYLVNSLHFHIFSYSDEALQTAFIYGEWYHNYDSFVTYKFLQAGRKIVYADDNAIENILKTVEEHQVP